MRTTEQDANPWYASYGCGMCPVVYQDLQPVIDPITEEQAVNDEGRALFTQDDAVPAGELNEHVDSWHAETAEDGENGLPVRAHLGQAPPA